MGGIRRSGGAGVGVGVGSGGVVQGSWIAGLIIFGFMVGVLFGAMKQAAVAPSNNTVIQQRQEVAESPFYDPINNPYMPPERAYLPSSYQQVGLLTMEGGSGTPTIMPLMGKPLYPVRRGYWHYYTVNSQNSVITTKLPIRVNGRECTMERGCDMISSGDEVTVEGYAPKIFKVTIYEWRTKVPP